MSSEDKRRTILGYPILGVAFLIVIGCGLGVLVKHFQRKKPDT